MKKMTLEEKHCYAVAMSVAMGSPAICQTCEGTGLVVMDYSKKIIPLAHYVFRSHDICSDCDGHGTFTLKPTIAKDNP